jgi:very-short-patch-repair endonuclease
MPTSEKPSTNATERTSPEAAPRPQTLAGSGGSARPSGARGLEALADRLVERQHGVATLSQLRELGFSRRMVSDRVRNGRFSRFHRGVYGVGPRLSQRTREMAAVLASGPDAHLSHRSAAGLWGLLPSMEPGPHNAPHPCEVAVVLSKRGGHHHGILAHRIIHLATADRALRHGIPVTSPGRTILDLAALASRTTDVCARDPLPTVSHRDLEQAVARAERDRLVTPAELRARLEASPRRGGIALLRRVLDLTGGPAFVRSEAERRFIDLLRTTDLPAPRVNARVGRFELDFYWERAGLAVEVDGFAHHAPRDRFESDRLRDAELVAQGIQVFRITWRQLEEAPNAVLGRVARALGRAEARAAGAR